MIAKSTYLLHGRRLFVKSDHSLTEFCVHVDLTGQPSWQHFQTIFENKRDCFRDEHADRRPKCERETVSLLLNLLDWKDECPTAESVAAETEKAR